MQRPTVMPWATALTVALLGATSLSGCLPTPGTGAPTAFNLPPTPVITSDVIRGVTPLTVQFSSDRSTDDGLIISRLWDFGDSSTSEEISPRHRFTTTGDFTVTLTLTDDMDADASRTLIISVTQAPVAVIEVSPTVAESAPAFISFDGTSSYDPDGDIEEYQWDFGDGTREFLSAVTHTYASAGTYRAKLTVTDDKGVTGSSERLIKVGIPTPEIEIRVPPPAVTNMVLSTEAPLWIQAVYEVEPGTARFVRAGIDQDYDQCEAQAVLYNILTGDPDAVLTGHDDRVNDVAFSPSGVSLVTASDDGTIRRYRVSNGDLIRTYTGQGRITSVAFSPNGEYLVWGQSDSDVVQAEVSSGTITRTYSGHTGAVNEVAFSLDGTQILSGSNDRRALLWNVADGTILRDFQHTLGVNAVAFSPADPTLVATGSEDQTIKLWNTTSGTELLTLTGHAGPVNDLVFSSDGMALISASDDETAKAWSPYLGTAVTTYSGHKDAVLSVAISRDGNRIVTGSADGSARVWDSVSAKRLLNMAPCESPISSVAISPDGRQFAAGVAARNDIQLDTDPANGNDLNITYPRDLVLTSVADIDYADVPAGQYYLWAEISTDQAEVLPARDYASTVINVVEPFTTTINTDTPIIPLIDGAASVVVAPAADRQIFDLGPLDRDDRLYLSLLTTPGFGETYDSRGEAFSVMVLDANQEIFAWYQHAYILFDANAKLVIGHNSTHYYVVVDGDFGVKLRVERDTGLFETRPQRVLVKFDGGTNVAAANQPPRTIPALDAGDFDGSWGDDETVIIKLVIMQTIENVYSGFDIEFVSSDDGVTPELPYQTVYVGGSTPDDLLGVADYVDPRNETATGTAIVYASYIAELGLDGDFENSVTTANDVGAAIGRVAAHEIGHLLGLRHTDDSTDIMQGSTIWEAADPTVPRILKSALVSAVEQLSGLDAIGVQDAPQLLQETVGLAP